jgi:23S rRNA pseudouridine1911/1915/1917 synthase
VIGRGRNLSEQRSRLTLEVRSSEPQRLDNWLVESLSWKSRNRLQRLIREGHVTINGDAAKASRRVRNGDVVELHLSDGVGVPDDYAERELEIVYEDDWLVAVNKPPDMLVHPVGRHVYDTLINYLHYRYHQPGNDGEEVIPRLCHRLDKDTTGVVVVGKNTYAHREIMYQFENRHVSKRYLTIVEGRFPDNISRIDVPIGEGRCLKSALAADVLKPSETLVDIVSTHDDFTVLRCVPSTGRQNQIRIHVAACGHPVVGDVRYGARETHGMATREGWPSRYLLHSEYLRFWHPRLKTTIELHAEAPEDLRSLL